MLKDLRGLSPGSPRDAMRAVGTMRWRGLVRGATAKVSLAELWRPALPQATLGRVTNRSGHSPILTSGRPPMHSFAFLPVDSRLLASVIYYVALSVAEGRYSFIIQYLLSYEAGKLCARNYPGTK